jgi:hypothetical protein
MYVQCAQNKLTVNVHGIMVMNKQRGINPPGKIGKLLQLQICYNGILIGNEHGRCYES